MRVALSKKPKGHGPGLVYIVVALVVVGVAAARFLGFSPGAQNDFGSRQEQAQDPLDPSDRGGVVPRPSQMTEVLIYHTHTTENYAPNPTHSTDGPGDVVAVGRALVDALRERGVEAVHTLTVHDLPDWSQSTVNARPSVRDALNRHSGIRVVIDVHRDAIPDQRTSGYATAQIGDEEVAKLLLIVGTSNNSRVESNMRFAERLKERLEALAPGITRGVRVLPQQTNGDLHDNHVTVYVGEYQDTSLKEATAAARWLALAVAELLHEDG